MSTHPDHPDHSAVAATIGVLEPQPTDPTQVPGWLDRLHTAATTLLPDQFTITVNWPDSTGQPLTLTFERGAASWDADEIQYRLTGPATVPHPDGTGKTRFDPDTLHLTGQWLNRRHIRRPLAHDTDFSRDFGNLIMAAIRDTPDADRAIALSELLRCIRVRQRAGEDAIRNGGHDTDISRLQTKLATRLS